MIDTVKRPRAGEGARRPHRAHRLRDEPQLADRFRAIESCCLRRRIPRDRMRGEPA